ncbi:MAG TPA: LppP/LprE family lipoprotein [Conexibacter sp.]|nr:LppP/LprE family lipoprotein [Conexibacter sp.]
MPSRRRIPLALAPAALVLLALAGCGGGTRPSAHVTPQTVTKTVTVPATTGTSSVTATAPATTSATPLPNPNASLSLRAAEQTLSARGYATLSERDWRPDQPLKVLVGVARRGPAGSRLELAFFFVGASYIGTDTRDPSGQIAVVAQGGDSVTLSYGLYRPSDAIDAPSAGTAQVTYRWTGARLVPQGAIPSAAPSASPGRR